MTARGEGIEEVRGPEAHDQQSDSGEAEAAQEVEQPFEGGEGEAGAERTEAPGPEGRLDVGMEVAGEAGGGGLLLPRRVVGVDLGEGFGVVAVEALRVAAGEHAAAQVGGGEVVAGRAPVASEGREGKDQQDRHGGGPFCGAAAEEVQLHTHLLEGFVLSCGPRRCSGWG